MQKIPCYTYLNRDIVLHDRTHYMTLYATDVLGLMLTLKRFQSWAGYIFKSKTLLINKMRQTHDDFPLPVGPKMAFIPGWNIPLKLEEKLATWPLSHVGTCALSDRQY
jgi:hypothetical protein